ncbi:hypothetical protein GCM10023115_44550 [Pontixanthobacter gangjinensis]|uniref:Uncharacterized protein n=1 Tax=Christiangramia aestuarii TaxID=1028746 RepID=A0A7M3SXX2_9FLAO|nr:DUF6090 family protein [Christiangramia aestuarii]MUP41453.1 hypothetical protein [Christiangramia aestuarii]
MIKFFRNIRRQLLRENRFTRYLIYAIGEIILVVIGILIALQINNWNENRKLNKAERGYLNSLQEDIHKDIKAQDSITPILKSNLEKLKDLEEELKKIDSDPNYEKALFSYLGSLGYPEFVSNDHTLETLKSSGNIEAISDKQLRRQILDYRDQVEVYERHQKLVGEMMLNFLTEKNIFNLNALNDETLRKRLSLRNIEKVKMTTFINQALIYQATIQDLIGRLEKLNVKAMQIREMISRSENNSE